MVKATTDGNGSPSAGVPDDRKENWLRGPQCKDDVVVSAGSFLQDHVTNMMSLFNSHEDAFFNKVKEGLMSAKEYPTAAIAAAVAAGFLLVRGPRRFLLRNTLRKFESEEAQLHRAEKNVKELSLSVDLMKKEGRKLLERVSLAELEVKRGYTELMDAGKSLHCLMRSTNKVEKYGSELMVGLREIAGREALKLRAEVASMASEVRRQRSDLDRRIIKISELDLPV